MADIQSPIAADGRRERTRFRPGAVAANIGGDLRDALGDFRGMKSLYASLNAADRVREQPALVSRYYDVVTRFYEYAWGPSFHFSPRRPGESLAASQRRHEEGIGGLLRLGPGIEVADIGCGVGGPLVTIGNSTGASITGINFNARQIARGQVRVGKAGLHRTCRFLCANFMDVPLQDGVFDAAYSFEAVCHAPDARLLFRELYRLLRAGGEIAIVDWCLTDRFDAADVHHRDVRDRLNTANATPGLLDVAQQLDAVRNAGFEILTAVDQQVRQGDPRTPWYMALEGRDLSLSSLARIPAGRRLTAAVTAALERVRIAPQGTAEAAALLNGAADALLEAGRLGIFTPSFLIHARKPGPGVARRDPA